MLRFGHPVRVRFEIEGMEAALRELLLPMLKQAVRGGPNPFRNSEFNPHGEPVSAKHERALELARGTLERRESLGWPTEEAVGALYLSSCAKYAAAEKAGRCDPGPLSEDLLRALSGA